MKLFITSAFIALLFSGYSQTDASDNLIALNRGIYKIKYPESWTLDTSVAKSRKDLFIDLLASSPSYEDEPTRIGPILSVLIEDYANKKEKDLKNVDVKKIKDLAEKDFKERGAKVKVFESAIVTIDSVDYYKVTYTVDKGKYTMKMWLRCFVKNNKSYCMSMSCDEEDAGKFKKIREEIDNSFSAVTLTDIIKQLVQ
jgi:hypothetical protein